MKRMVSKRRQVAMHRAARLAGVLCLVAMRPVECCADGDIAWRHRATSDGVTLTANPLAAEQRTAFYLARGFSAAGIQPYARTCAFSFAMQNDSTRTVVSRLQDWHAVGADGQTIRLRLPESWEADWQAAAVPPSARIAFRWAQFQSTSSFQPGDWIMGMATFATPPVAPFRLIARYYDDTQGKHEIFLDQLACAED